MRCAIVPMQWGVAIANDTHDPKRGTPPPPNTLQMFALMYLLRAFGDPHLGLYSGLVEFRVYNAEYSPNERQTFNLFPQPLHCFRFTQTGRDLQRVRSLIYIYFISTP